MINELMVQTDNKAGKHLYFTFNVTLNFITCSTFFREGGGFVGDIRGDYIFNLSYFGGLP